MRALAPFGVLCVLALVAAFAVHGPGAAAHPPASEEVGAQLIARIDHYRNLAWRWQRLLGVPPTSSTRSERRSPDVAYRRWVLRLWQGRAARAERRAAPWVAARVAGFRRTVVHWERVMGVRSFPQRATESAAIGLEGRMASYDAWRRRARAVLRRAARPPYESAFRCIHRFEGAWTDGGAPYYGGLQMDLGFQRRYGAYLLQTKGTADHWSPLEQLWVAARAARSGRGFWPWPNSARICGLI